MLRLPNNAVQKELYRILTEIFADKNVAVYDYVPFDAQLPYITLGAVTMEDISTKTEPEYKIAQQINIWSDYQGKREINNIAEYIINTLTGIDGHMELKVDGFFCWRQKIDMYEAYPEGEDGYNGVISFVAYIQGIEDEKEKE
jgi:hypothetical protein